MTKFKAQELLKIYGEAWEEKDMQKILSIFTQGATYHDPREPVAFGHDGIRKYWTSKVIEGQKDIHFKILKIWTDGDDIIAEWYADFLDNKTNTKIEMMEVGIFTTEGDLFSSLREYYWTNKKVLN